MVSPASKPTFERFFHYLPITDRIFHSGFYITSAGKETVPPGSLYPPVRHPSLYHFSWENGRTLPEFSCVLITGGRGFFETQKTGRVPVEKGMAMFVFPGMWHRYAPDSKTGWTEEWVQFNGEFAHRLEEDGILVRSRPVVHLRNMEEAQEAMNRLLMRIHAEPAENSLAVSLDALRLLSAASECRELPGRATPTPAVFATRSKDRIVEVARNFIWTHSHRVLSVQDVASHAQVTRRTLERHMFAALGRTVLDEIVQCRFNRAERLVRETDLPIKVVVSLAGFGSAENMRQLFLSRTGLSPAAYRHSRQPRGTSAP